MASKDIGNWAGKSINVNGQLVSVRVILSEDSPGKFGVYRVAKGKYGEVDVDGRRGLTREEADAYVREIIAD